MYINAQLPPVLTLAAPAELSVHRELETSSLNLRPYQVIRATVVEGGFDRVMLSVRHQQLAAETRVPLRSGQKLHLQVLSTHPELHLRIMEAAELRYLFRTLHSLGQGIEWLDLLQQVQSSERGRAGSPERNGDLNGLIRLLQSSPGDIRGADLARLWTGLGLDLEALLAGNRNEKARSCLKSALLVLASKSGAPEPVEKVLDQFTLFQLCRHRLDKEDVVFLPLPFPFLEQGYLLAENETGSDRIEGKSPSVWRISLHLKMTGIGTLEVRLLLENRDLRLRILCESRKVAGMLAGALPRLQDRLTTVVLRGYSVDIGAEDPARTLVRRLAPDGDHFLEIEA